MARETACTYFEISIPPSILVQTSAFIAQLDAMAELMESWCRAEKCIDKKRRLRLSRVYVYTKEAGIKPPAHILKFQSHHLSWCRHLPLYIPAALRSHKYGHFPPVYQPLLYIHKLLKGAAFFLGICPY